MIKETITIDVSESFLFHMRVSKKEKILRGERKVKEKCVIRKREMK